MLMLLRRKRLLVVYMGCMAAACLLAYNLLPPVNHDNVPRLRMLQENSANDSTADLTLLLDQIDEHLQQVSKFHPKGHSRTGHFVYPLCYF